MVLDREVVGIYLGDHPYKKKFTWKNLEEGGIGGSEYWALKLGQKLSDSGRYGVILFTDTNTVEVINKSMIIVPYYLITNLSHVVDFDFFISSRRLDVFETTNIQAKHKILMLHDVWVLGKIPITSDCLKLFGIEAICYQSEYQKAKILEHYPGIDETYFIKADNGVDILDYKDVNNIPKKNKMLLSSGRGRGDKFLVEYVFDKIKAKIPDFEVEVCGYNDNTSADYFSGKDYIHFLGNITHSELVKHQLDSKIWIYPNHGWNDNMQNENTETFCLTAIENGMAKNAIVCANWGCFSDTLNGYIGFVGDELFDNIFNVMNQDKLEKFAEELANASIKALEDDKYRRKLANNAYEVCHKHTLDNVCNSWIKIFEKLNKK